jgi:uncharacterized paraquat-inducible protein A
MPSWLCWVFAALFGVLTIASLWTGQAAVQTFPTMKRSEQPVRYWMIIIVWLGGCAVAIWSAMTGGT